MVGIRGLACALLLLVSALAVAAPSGLVARLRSGDPADRREVLAELAAASDEELGEVQRKVSADVRKLLAKDTDPAIRAAAARVLARLGGKRALESLVAALRTERDPAAAEGLVTACADLRDDGARRAVSALAFDAQAPRSAALAAEALGALPTEAAVDDLLALLRAAPHWAVAAAACRGLAGRRDLRVPPQLVRRLRHPDAAVRSAAREALIVLCGVDHGVEPRKWEDWWYAVGDVFRFPDREDDPLPTPEQRERRDGATSDEWAAGDRPTFARFFGIELRGRRVCFVIDYSQSMWGPRRNRAQRELIDAVKGLPGTHTFGVILFNEKVWWFGDGPLPARPQQKLDLVDYLPEQETKSYTNLYDSLERALGLLGVGGQAVDPAPGLDEIVVLSDGVPNRGKIKDPDRILEAIELLNGGRVKIHTVSLGDEEFDLLPRLAEQNGGRHVRHPFPK